MTSFSFRLHFINIIKCRFLKIPYYNVQFYSSNMPNPKRDILKLQQQYVKTKERKAKYESGSVYLQIMGSGAKGIGNSVYLFSDHSKYLFNCGEGTQRLAHEHKIKISKLEHIFITYPRWENIGGLTGLALTLQDSGTPELSIHGPYGVDRIFKVVKPFVILNDFLLKSAICNKDAMYQDSVLTVRYVPIFKKDCESKNGNSQDNNDIDSDGNNHEQRKCHSHDSFAVNNSNNYEAVSVVSMAYICKLAAKSGSLNLEACVERGVPPGPLLGKLKAGQDVILSNGTCVKSVDVMSPDVSGAVFIIVECPTDEFVDSLLKEDMFKKHQSESSNENDLASVVVHFSPISVMQNSRYKEWMDRFPETTIHVNVNERNRCLGSSAIHEAQYKLNMLEDNLFPLLKDVSLPLVKVSTPVRKSLDELCLEKCEEIADELLPPIDIGYTLRAFCFKPKLMLTRTGPMLQRCPNEVLEQVMKLEGFESELIALKSKLQNFDNIRQKEYPHVVFLGTGSSIPSKTRNVSAILLAVSPTSNTLLDCGEGTYTQLVRFYGLEEIDDILIHLNCIYVSHLHADHHIGLIGLLKARRIAFNNRNLPFKKLLLLAPDQIADYLNKFDRIFESIKSDYILIPNQKLNYKNPDKSLLESIDNFNSLQLDNVLTTEVIHCPNSFGVTISHANGWKLTYSGDTMPCASLVDLGMDSDLLIHEATMEDELIDEAKYKMHSTVSQALDISCQMKAKFTILTHFSQRYAKIPRLDHKFANDVGIAFDNMKVRFTDFPKLPLLYSALKVMFSEEQHELEHRGFKRKQRHKFLEEKRTRIESNSV